ncbi:MAG: family 10 glycosylhydrolase [Phycisphaerales bacterium]|nr:MAG: family 10 glycosylhydrolase [Phycisphaerales bacterium]
MSYRNAALCVAIFCIALPTMAEQLPPIPTASYDTVDDLSYSQQSARRLWKPMARTSPVSVVDIGGRKALRMPCNFRGTKFDRASWDRNLKLDLSMRKGLQFLFHCRDASPIANFTIYLHSGDGWYRAYFDAPAKAKWTSVKIHKKDMAIEGQPAGWSNIDTVRISAWRGQDVDTEFYIAEVGLFGEAGKVVIVRGDSAARNAPGEVNSVKEYTEVMAHFLDRGGLSSTILSDLDVTAGRLKDIRLIILPHNPNMPDSVADEIASFIKAGGKLIACYQLPNRLQPVVGIRTGRHVRQEYQGHFASIRPSDKPLKGAPPVTQQASWNIQQASAINGRARIAAWWHNNKDQTTGKPAIVVSENCVYLTHVLLGDDQTKKLQLLLAMIGNIAPELWREAAEGSLLAVGQLGPYNDYESARGRIRELTSDDTRALRSLESADRLRKQALTLLSEDKFSEAIVTAEKAKGAMLDAYCLAQRPLAGEHRAFWCHSAFGVSGMSWDQAIRLLAENGFTAILPNMLWGGVAYYRSDVLPASPAVEERGDQIALCVAACKKYGIQCHVWKVNFNMGRATDSEFVARMKAEGRTQVQYDGSTNDRWLCPSDPKNQELEIESMLETGRNYDVDGLHFDYIRYPGNEACFCDGCRLRFEKTIGGKIDSWPRDVRNLERLRDKWLDFRRQQITAVVAAVAQRAKQIRSDLKISAAVFRNWPVDRNSVGQDWKLWCDRRYLDFVCPMDYTSSSSQFHRMVENQLAWTGKVPCYPGIGLTVWSDSTDVCKLIEQISITRQLATGGFTIFNYGPTEATRVLPLLGKGMTRSD